MLIVICLTLTRIHFFLSINYILDLNISLTDGKFICSFYDKRDKFKFSAVVRLTSRFSNQSDNVGYCTLASQKFKILAISFLKYLFKFL